MAVRVFEKLKDFSRMLGWKRLKRHEHIWEDEAKTIVWYESGDVFSKEKLPALQINHHPIDQQRHFAVCVYALRYRLCSGWHEFDLHARPLEKEADRLRDLVAHEWFHSPGRRREYRTLHPECTGFTQKRVSERGVPGQPNYRG